MSDAEMTHAQLIEEIISRKLKPFYWLVSIAITLFGIVSVPIAAQVISITQNQGVIEVKVNQKIDSDEAYRNFLSKGVYHLLQKDEHESDQEAIANPANSAFIYMKNNNKEAEQLDLSSRSANYKEAYNKVIQNQK